MTKTQRLCLSEATISDLRAFPRGFARTKMGPFFGIGTINTLVRKGFLRAYHPRRGVRGLRISVRVST